MAFSAKSGEFNAEINTVEIGTGDRAIRLGGENVMPFYTFDAGIANAPKVGIEITDGGMEAEPECVRKCYEGCVTVVDMAKKAVSFAGVDFLSIRLEGGDPNGLNKSAEELIQIVKDVASAVDVPLVVCGCNNTEKDSELLEQAAAVLEGRNAVILAADEENYRTLGASVGLTHRQVLGAESAVDINLAKQLNVLLSQLGVDRKTVLMNVGAAAAGYGFEYLVSTMDRVKAAALQQGDATLQMPIITPVASEAWNVKEAVSPEEDSPEWGSQEERAIDMEIETAAAVLASGSDGVILRHPESVKTIRNMIGALM